MSRMPFVHDNHSRAMKAPEYLGTCRIPRALNGSRGCVLSTPTSQASAANELPSLHRRHASNSQACRAGAKSKHAAHGIPQNFHVGFRATTLNVSENHRRQATPRGSSSHCAPRHGRRVPREAKGRTCSRQLALNLAQHMFCSPHLASSDKLASVNER